MTHLDIRGARPADLAALQSVAVATGLFPPEMLPDMISPFLAGDEDSFWLTAVAEHKPVGLAFTQVEPMTEGTWNMLALAVHPDYQGKGLGRMIVQKVEHTLVEKAARLVIVDTSGTESFAKARAFYQALGYEVEARIRDFWSAGDDKVTLRKSL